MGELLNRKEEVKAIVTARAGSKSNQLRTSETLKPPTKPSKKKS